MHNLTTYSLRAEVMGAVAEARLRSIDQAIDDWLQKKGADNPVAPEGTFASRTGDGSGKFTRVLTTTDIGGLREVQLIEMAHTGQLFTTTIQVANESSSVNVFATLSVTGLSSVVTPVQIYPRCPQVVRTLIDTFSDWTFGGQLVPGSVPIEAKGGSAALRLCDHLQDGDRNLPIIAISIDPDEMIWTKLPVEMARDLSGIAYVAVIDAEGSWAMTDELGKNDSCYLGAVRLYWPITSTRNGSPVLKGTVWTASRLSETYGNDDVGMRRFLSSVRQTIMSTAALTVAPPKCIRDIQNAATRERLRNLATEVRDKELDAIVEENASLSARIDEANIEIAALRWKVEHLRERQGDSDDEAGLNEDKAEAVHVSPTNGEVRYYKKIGNKGGVDTLVMTPSCKHKESSWRPAFKGDQAEKGLAKLEGRTDWKSLKHCGACTGGGRWRVQW